MLSFDEIKTAVEWLVENNSYKLFKWTIENFGGFNCKMVDLLKSKRYDCFAKEIEKYGVDIQSDLVELMY